MGGCLRSKDFQIPEKALLLGDLLPGECARVQSLDATHPLAEQLQGRLEAFGFVAGTLVRVLHQAPLSGDPIAVFVRGMRVALRREEARVIRVVPCLA